jgi:hypothetical protein
VTTNPPDAVDDLADAVANVPVNVDVLANDTDADGDVLTVVVVTQPANGTASIVGGASVSYTANPGYIGPDAFTYSISDGNGGFDTANVFVTVSIGENGAPTPVDDSATTNFGIPVTIPVLANDTDPNGDPLSVVAVGAAVGGTVTTDGVTVTFEPDVAFSGVTNFTYTVADTRGGQSVGNVTVTVRAQETIGFTRAEFRTSAPGQYRIDGTGSVGGSSITLELIRNGSVFGPTIATVSVDGATGLWTFRGGAAPGFTPVAGDRVRATSSLGTVREQNLTVRR